MKQFEVTAAMVTLRAGRVQLTSAQHKTRAHALNTVGKDVHEIVTPVQFKRGEAFGWDGAVDKVLVGQITERAGKAARKGEALL